MQKSKNPVIKKSSTIFPYRGKWRVQFFDVNGSIRTKTVASKFEAYQFLVEQNKIPDAERIRGSDGATWTVQEWFEYAIRVSKTRVKASTYERNSRLLEMYLYPVLGRLPLTDLRPLHIDQIYRSLVNASTLSISSIWRLRGAILGPLRLAMFEGLITTPGFTEARPPSIPTKRKKLITDKDYEALDLALPQLEALLQLRWRLALEYGLRQGEALGLRWGDFDLRNGTVSIQRTVRNHGSKGLYVSRPKTASGVRVIPLRSKTMQLIREAAGDVYEAQSWVFKNTAGLPWDPTVDRRLWGALLSAAGVETTTVHAARHFTASRMISSGADLKSVQALLGHSSPNFTVAVYSHTNLGNMKRAIEISFW